MVKMKLSTYGALRIKNENLQNQVHQLQEMVNLLQEEMCIQHKVISQLKLL